MNIKSIFIVLIWLLWLPQVFAQDDVIVDPILISANDNILMRSFVDIKDAKRITHAISVGSAEQIHYTYDANNGKLILLWRGGFLDATPMWHKRGDGSSKPLGKPIQFGESFPEIQRLKSVDDIWKSDTTGSGFKPKGYTLDKSRKPTFRYFTYGVKVSDVIRVSNGEEGIKRVISLQGTAEKLYIRLARTSALEDLGKGKYAIDNEAYYIQITEPENSGIIIRDSNGKKELLMPIKLSISYSILFNK